MFGLGVAKGMLTTLKHILFVKPVTIQYPEQRMEMPTWTRGRPRLIYDLDSGDLRCTACGACAIACPVDVIQIHQHPGPERGKKILDRFDLDMGGCIECALCVEACPFRAIVMAPDFEMATYDRANSLVFNMHQLRIAGTPEVDAAMEYIQGIKRGLAAQAARGAAPARPGAARPAAAAGGRPTPPGAGAAARPAGAVAARPAGPGGARPEGAPPRPAPAPGAGPARPTPAAARPSEQRPGPEAAPEGPEAGKGPARPAPQTGPRPMTATRARLLAQRGQSPGGSAADEAATVEATGAPPAPGEAGRPLPTEPRSPVPGTEEPGQTPSATPATHPAATPEAVDQQQEGRSE
jgi:formate hydrogenlyase subunit 6/NADH:ubiquinone oxidoreductase subunit I